MLVASSRQAQLADEDEQYNYYAGI
jgi:hypothetical protein